MKRKPFPLWVLGLIAALVGGAVALNVLSQKAQNQNVHVEEPDHNQ